MPVTSIRCFQNDSLQYSSQTCLGIEPGSQTRVCDYAKASLVHQSFSVSFLDDAWISITYDITPTEKELGQEKR